MSETMINLLINATWQTVLMVFISGAIAVLFGLPFGVLLLITDKHHVLDKIVINRLLALIINVVRSIPFIILMVAITPFTRFIVGTSIGTIAAMVPLTLAAIPFFARLAESAMKEVSHGLLEASLAMGASSWQIVHKVLIPESLSGLVRGVTLTLITLVGYSAMAGAIGGGGLGDIGIRYGYDRFNSKVMLATVIILIVIVQLLQWLGDRVANRLSHHKESFSRG